MRFKSTEKRDTYRLKLCPLSNLTAHFINKDILSVNGWSISHILARLGPISIKMMFKMYRERNVRK